ncbi:MAG: hypothetical protein V4628_18100 [Pseudomonadota bacterium]
MNILSRDIWVVIPAAFLRYLLTLPLLGTKNSLPFNALLLNYKVINKTAGSLFGLHALLLFLLSKVRLSGSFYLLLLHFLPVRLLQ